MCNCAHEVAGQLGQIQTDLTWIKEESRRDREDLHERINDLQVSHTLAIKEQTAVNSAIHGRISSVKYLTLGALAVGATLGAGVDWFLGQITKIGN